jgi:hypothetical protein
MSRKYLEILLRLCNKACNFRHSSALEMANFRASRPQKFVATPQQPSKNIFKTDASA